MHSRSTEGAPRLRDLPPLRDATVLQIDDDVARELVSDKVRHMYNWWRRAAGGQPPYWSQFDVTDHGRIVANAFLVKRLAAGSWYFTLKGEAVHALFPSYKTPDAIANIPDRAVAAALTAHYDEVARTGRCHLVRGIITGNGDETIEIESLDCPFREAELGRMAILGVVERIAVLPPITN